jgi:hypothetical protein
MGREAGSSALFRCCCCLRPESVLIQPSVVFHLAYANQAVWGNNVFPAKYERAAALGEAWYAYALPAYMPDLGPPRLSCQRIKHRGEGRQAHWQHGRQQAGKLADSRYTGRHEGTYWQACMHIPGRQAHTGMQAGTYWQAARKAVTHWQTGRQSLASSREGRQTHTGRLAGILACRQASREAH